MIKRISALLLTAAVALFLLAGCSAKKDASEGSEPEIDFESMFEEIYSTVGEVEGLEDADDETVKDVLMLPLEDIEEYHIRYGNGIYGLADTYIIKPKKDKKANIRTQLEIRRDARISELESININGASETAKNAVIYDRGDYLIMLMHSNNDEVKEIIAKYIY